MAKTELLPGTLDMLILAVLSRAPIHGFAIAGWIHQLSSNVLPSRKALASWLPARRAARVDPVRTLRSE